MHCALVIVIVGVHTDASPLQVMLHLHYIAALVSFAAYAHCQREL